MGETRDSASIIADALREIAEAIAELARVQAEALAFERQKEKTKVMPHYGP